MKNAILLACVALVAAAGAANVEASDFNTAEKAMLRGLAAQMQTKLKKAIPLGNKAITILPVRGDKDSYMEQQLIEALVNSGLTVVVSNDEKKDERFRKILEAIRWDAVQKRLGSIDPQTVDELGRLMSTQIFLEARLNIASYQSSSGKSSSMSAELNLLAYAVQTKKYVWSTTAVASESYEGKPRIAVLVGVSPETLPLNVKVEVKPSDATAGAVADRLDTLLRGSLVELGYLVDTAKPDDMTLSVDVSKSEFDKTGSYLVFDGSAKARASVAGAKARLLGETDITGHGMRGLGAAAANRNLADALFEQLSPWVKRTLKADAVGFEAVAFTVGFPGPVEGAADIAPIETFRRTIMSMDGVRGFSLAGQDLAVNSATFRVVYEKGKFPIGFVNTLFTTHPELEKLLGD